MAVLGGKTKIKINHKTRFLLNNERQRQNWDSEQNRCESHGSFSSFLINLFLTATMTSDPHP